MRARAIIEALILSLGLIACAATALIWTTSLDWSAVRASMTDPQLWASARNSLEIGIVAGVLLALSTLAFACTAIYFDIAIPLPVKILAMASALAPDLVHALIWRTLLQPGYGLQWLQRTAASPSLQPSILSLVLAVKWSALLAISATVTFPEDRRALDTFLRLAGSASPIAFWRVVSPHAKRWFGLAFVVGLLLGLRQHELSEALLGGGSGFAAEGLSQWITKVALAFLDPGRAAMELLSAIMLILLGLLAFATASTARWAKPWLR